MNIEESYKQLLIEELLSQLNGHWDGSRRNILADQCPFCGKRGGKFAVYAGPDSINKRFGMANCFVCNRHFRTLDKTLEALGREDLIPKETTELEDLPIELTFDEDEIDDEVYEIKMPPGYRQTFKNQYLKSRGWILDDFEFFPVGTNRNLDFHYNDYVILEILEEGKRVGFVARSIYSKEELDRINAKRRIPIQRYKNSNGEGYNPFGKLLYNYDSIKPYLTHTVVICEGPMDVVALTRKLNWYDNESIQATCTFGKKISQTQIYKLQKKSVEQVVLAFDADAKEATAKVAEELEKYFEVLICDLSYGKGKDFDELDVEDIYDCFLTLKTLREFNLS